MRHVPIRSSAAIFFFTRGLFDFFISLITIKYRPKSKCQNQLMLEGSVILEKKGVTFLHKTHSTPA